MSLSFNREVYRVPNIPRRGDFTRPHLNYNPLSDYRKPYNLRFRVPKYHPTDWVVGDYLYGYQITDVLN